MKSMKYCDHATVKDIETLNLHGCGGIKVHFFAKMSSATLDLSLQFHTNLFEFPDFTMFRLDLGPKNKIVSNPSISYVLIDHVSPFLAIIGTYEIVGVNCGTGHAKKLIRLKRLLEDDSGYFFENVIPVENGFVYIYERGCVRIDHNGSIIWEHDDLYADDIFLGVDENSLRYHSEFGARACKYWCISISDGSISEERQ